MKGFTDYRLTFLQIFISTIPAFYFSLIGFERELSNETPDYRSLFFFGLARSGISLGLLFSKPRLVLFNKK